MPSKQIIQTSLPIPSTVKPKRVRERSIQEAIKAVAIWRRLYNGIMRAGDVLIRYTLDDAARKVGMSKKTLDDYLHLLRLGRKYEFPFKVRQDDKVGVLRKYITKAKLQEARQTKREAAAASSTSDKID